MITPDPSRAALERIVNDEWPEYEDHLVAGTTPSLVLDYIRRDLRAALAQPTPPAPVGPMEGITPKEWDAFEAATGTVERCVYPGCTLPDDKGQCAECDRERDHWVHGSDVKFNAGHPFRIPPYDTVTDDGSQDTTVTPTLDSAWARVERLLPEGWMVQCGMTVWPEPERRYAAVAHKRDWRPEGWDGPIVRMHPDDHRDDTGSTPVEALDNLAAALAARQEGS